MLRAKVKQCNAANGDSTRQGNKTVKFANMAGHVDFFGS
jgi:hypothetical protein